MSFFSTVVKLGLAKKAWEMVRNRGVRRSTG
jgi:hypothetical protein